MKKEIIKPIYDLDEWKRDSDNKFVIGLVSGILMFILGVLPALVFGVLWSYSQK